NGMLLNMAQTWHQVRPSEVRNNCGGCHAHSQQPTLFEKTAASRADYAVFDLTQQTPLLTRRTDDQSDKKWDERQETGLRYHKAHRCGESPRNKNAIPKGVCGACHSRKLDKPAGKLVLDDDTLVEGPHWDLGNAGKVPASYNTLAGNYIGVTHYIRGFQSRR